MGNIPTAHVTAGRRAPGLLKQQACGGAAVGGSHAAAVLGLASKPRPERIIAECQKPEAIAKVGSIGTYQEAGASSTCKKLLLLGSVGGIGWLEMLIACSSQASKDRPYSMDVTYYML